MYPAVDNSVTLQVNWSDFHLSLDLVGGGAKQAESHGCGPATHPGVERGGKVAIGRGGQGVLNGHDFRLQGTGDSVQRLGLDVSLSPVPYNLPLVCVTIEG